MIPSDLWNRPTDIVRELNYLEARDPNWNEHGLKGEQQQQLSRPWFQRSRPTRGGTVRQHTIACKSRSTIILTVCCSSQRVICLGSVRSGWTAPHFDHKAATSTTGPYPTPAPSDGGRHTSESRAYCQVSLPSMCPICHQSRSKLPVHQMYWMGACEMFRTLKCSTVSEK